MPLTLHPYMVSRKALAAGSVGKITRSSPAASALPLKVSGIGRDWPDYEGCTVIKANRTEAAEALGCHVGDPPAMIARRLAIRQGCHVVVTAGELGLWWSDGQKVRRVPAVPVQVRDVCGAGDTVLATLGVAMAAGRTFADGCRRAVRMAAEQVGQVGVRRTGNQIGPSDDSKKGTATLGHNPQGVVFCDRSCRAGIRFHSKICHLSV